MTLRLDFTEDPREFLDRASAVLEADPVLGTVVATVTSRAAADAGAPRPAYPCWWLSVSDGDAVVGLAMRTAQFPPHPLYVLPMPDEAAVRLGGALVERGEEVVGVNGALPAARLVAEEVARRTGGVAEVREHTRLHVLEKLVDPPDPGGRARVAGRDDVALSFAWFRAFHADAAAQAGRAAHSAGGELFDRTDVLRRVLEGRVWLWEDEHGEVVDLTGFNAPSFGVARVGPVYTPPAHRGRGYASALVAHVSRVLQDGGARVCLFTDQANPTSNKIYRAVGYVPVVDMANLVIGPALTTPAPA